MKTVSQVILALAFVAAVVGAVVFLVRGSASGGGIEIVLPAPTPTLEAVADMRVYVTGAVREPGVYVVGPESRLTDAIAAAGGATADADLTAVNLAVRVRDEQHWHIPSRGEEVQAPPDPLVPQASPAAGTTSSGKIDINSAGGVDLESLPEIGPALARRIIDYREANGPFSSVDGLLDVRGIGPATLDAVRDLVEAR
jgi:competence protein ComEA